MKNDIRRVRRRRPVPSAVASRVVRPPAHPPVTRTVRAATRPTKPVAPPPAVPVRPPARPELPLSPERFALPRLRTVGVSLVLLAAVVLVGLRAQGSVAETKGDVAARVQVAQQALSAAEDRLRATDLPGAKRQFEIAEQSLGQANQLLADTGLIGGMAAGQGSGDIRTAQQILAAGQDTARDGRKLLTDIQTIGAQAAGSNQGFSQIGEAVTAQLPNVQRDLSDLDRNLKLLDFLQQRAAGSHNPELLAVAKQFAVILPKSREAVAGARQLADVVPELLGRDEFKRYLLLFENPAELRATGGFTGTYGRLTLDNGRLRELTIESIYNPANQAKNSAKRDAPHPLVRLAGPELLMQDANWNPDFSKTAEQYQWFYGKAGGPSTDGVIAVTATPVVEMLKILGPIEQPDGREPITADSFLRDVTTYQQDQVKAGGDPKTLLRDFVPRLLEKIRRAPADQQRQVEQILKSAVAGRDIQLYFNDDALERLADRSGMSGRLTPHPGELAVVDSNLGANKSSADVAVTVNRAITIDSRGHQRTQISITRRHSGATSADTNTSFVRMYVPGGSTVENLDGWSSEDAPNVSQESGFTIIGGWSDVAPGEEQTLQATYQPPQTVDLRAGTVPISFWRQAGSNVTVNTEITLPDGYVWDGQPGGVVTGNVIRFSEPARSDLSHQLTFRTVP